MMAVDPESFLGVFTELIVAEDAREDWMNNRQGLIAGVLRDEPTGDLDRATADEILTILQLLNDKFEKTIVMVTHDPQAAKFAKRTLHLDKGEFVEKDLAA